MTIVLFLDSLQVILIILMELNHEEHADGADEYVDRERYEAELYELEQVLRLALVHFYQLLHSLRVVNRVVLLRLL